MNKQLCNVCQLYVNRQEIQKFGQCSACHDREVHSKSQQLADHKGKWGVFIVKEYINEKPRPDYSSLLSSHATSEEAEEEAEQQKDLQGRPDIMVEEI